MDFNLKLNVFHEKHIDPKENKSTPAATATSTVIAPTFAATTELP